MFRFRQSGVMSQIGDLLDAVLPSKNLFYAFKSTRCLRQPAQARDPETVSALSDNSPGVALQSVFTYGNVLRTAVGIRCPAFVKGINQVGEHALRFTTGQVTVEIQVL